MERRKVIVVGAGLAGLAAAYELSKKPHLEVHLVEKENRVGGRVHTMDVNGTPVDFGGFMIFPWYHHFHAYLRELDLDQKIKLFPRLNVYFDLDRDQNYISSQYLPWSAWSFTKLFVKIAPRMLGNMDPTNPHVHRFGDATIKEFLHKALGKKQGEVFERFFSATSEGYTYGPIDAYKMSLSITATMKSLLQGNLHDSSYFPEGTALLTKTLAQKIKDQGGMIHLKTEVKNLGDVKADAVVFAQTIDNTLHSKLLKTKVNCPYTQFATLAVQFTRAPKVPDTTWGAIFYEPQKGKDSQVLSAINLDSLYPGSFKKTVLFNIVLRKKTRVTKASMMKILQSEVETIFPGAKMKEIMTLQHWKQTMPIAQESLIDHLRHNQGRNGYYYAGDVLGVPSMETALATGQRIARRVSRDMARKR